MDEFLARRGDPRAHRLPRRAHHARVSLVVVGNAISRGNPELETVLDRKIRYCSLPEAIREHFLWGAHSIVIAGTHGKTTTTSLTGWLLTHGALDPSVLVGGIALNFGEQGSSYRLGRGREFVIEGDEYDSAFFDKTAKFLKYLPDIAVINNVEFDHADIYADLDAVDARVPAPREPGAAKRAAVARRRQPGRARRSKRRRSRGSRRSASADDADWQAHDLELGRRGHPVQAATPWLAVRRLRVAAPRRAQRPERGSPRSLSATDARDYPPAHRGRACARFRGVKRRLEAVGVADGVTIYDDFAHHPTAVAETIAGRAGAPRTACLGRVRTALRLLMPPCFPGRLRPGLCRRRRNRARPRPIDATGGSAAVGPTSSSPTCNRSEALPDTSRPVDRESSTAIVPGAP